MQRSDGRDSGAMTANDAASKKTLEVPNAQIGAVIGRGGCVVKMIRQTSGASIDIDHAAGDCERSCRRCEIGGIHLALSTLWQRHCKWPCRSRRGSKWRWKDLHVRCDFSCVRGAAASCREWGVEKIPFSDT